MLSPRYDAEGLRRPHDEETDFYKNTTDYNILPYLCAMYKYRTEEKFTYKPGCRQIYE
jgi:hypothetical protein